ncbi:MAG: hypothetical protein AB7I30_01515 [Isosphaeraceae bacterium]
MTSVAPNHPAVVGRIFANPTLPTQGGRYFSARPVHVGGAEVESGLGTLTPDSARSFLVFVPGASAPAVGDDLVCRFVGNRWVAERSVPGVGNDQVVVPGCPCASSPRVLRMSSSDPLSNNRMFQDATIEYRAFPAALSPLGLTGEGYLSTLTYTDETSVSPFWYHVTCSQGFYTLTRLYASFAAGPPYRDVVRYKWLMGVTGNTCQPFLLSSGLIYSGGDPSCVVTITE